jgi:hypothetical protein
VHPNPNAATSGDEAERTLRRVDRGLLFAAAQFRFFRPMFIDFPCSFGWVRCLLEKLNHLE